MSIIEFRGGPITHRYLMNKSKSDLALMYMELLDVREADLTRYGMHLAYCPRHVGKDCECGLSELTGGKK